MTFFKNFSIQEKLQLFVEELEREIKFSGSDLATMCIWISQRVARVK